jgi:hypothetical protein
MKTNKALGILVVFVTLAACAPLQQAPLIYSSKTTVGIDVSTPTSEQPGVTINIGFKMVDAAYVPVAVAKECDTKKGSKNCEDPMYKLTDAPLARLNSPTFGQVKLPQAGQTGL